MSKNMPDEIWIWRNGYYEPRISHTPLHPSNYHYLLATNCRKAAQDLLEACKALVELVREGGDCFVPEIVQGEEAIAKAEVAHDSTTH